MANLLERYKEYKQDKDQNKEYINLIKVARNEYMAALDAKFSCREHAQKLLSRADHEKCLEELNQNSEMEKMFSAKKEEIKKSLFETEKLLRDVKDLQKAKFRNNNQETRTLLEDKTKELNVAANNLRACIDAPYKPVVQAVQYKRA